MRDNQWRRDLFYKDVAQIHPNVTIVSDYIGGDAQVEARCKCGCTFQQIASRMVRGRKQGCPECSKRKHLQSLRSKNHDKLVIKFKSIADQFNLDLDETTIEKTSGYTAIITCRSCGDSKRRFVKSIAGQVHGCKPCSISKTVQMTNSGFVTDYIERVTSEYKIKGVPSNIRQSVKCKCRKCGEKFYKTLKQLASGVSGCPKCGLEKVLHSPKRVYTKVKLGKRKVKVCGFEKDALTYMLQFFKAKDIRITSDTDCPIISYDFEGKPKRYFPDLFLPKRNEIVEVKSIWTMGLKSDTPTSWRMLQAKRRACLDQGYRFKVLAFTSYKKDIITITDEVMESSLKKARKLIRKLNPSIPAYELDQK